MDNVESKGRLIMQIDIEVPKVENVYISAIKEWDEDFKEQHWNIYLINDRNDVISTILILSQGKSEEKKTTILRHSLGDLKPHSSVKVEFISMEVLGFTNEYMVTFFVGNKLFDRNFVFDPNSISDKNISKIPVMDVEGILAK